MKLLPLLGLLAGAIAIWYVLSRSTESFVPEFLDREKERTTALTAGPSYAQRTNHGAPPAPGGIPLFGQETPFQVNQFKAYMP